MGFFDKLKEGLKKTTALLNTDIRDLFKSQGRLVDDAFLDELYAALIKTDMGVPAAKETIDEIGTLYRARVVEMSEVIGTVKTKLKSLMAQPSEPIKFAPSGPTVVMVCGVNGAGKTTSIAKLTQMFRNQGKTVLLGAADTFRAAAVEQLTIWAGRLGAEIVTGPAGSDPASVAHKAVQGALDKQVDVCIIDTAGRLQTQTNLMTELTKIRRVIGKLIPEAPHEVLLVLDATVGQNGLQQAREFTSVAGVTGIVLTKLDGTAKGGVAVAIAHDLKLPIRYVGVGEGIDDLIPFSAQEYVDALFQEKW